MADENDTPVDRDAWRGLLARGRDKPSELTDARIRAAARRAVPPRSARWWLPASLAASMLLAVLVVQWQYEARGPAAVLLESDVAAPAVESAPAADAALERLDQPAPMLESREAPRADAQRKSEIEFYDLDMAPKPLPPAEVPPAVPPPLIDLPMQDSRSADAVAPNSAPAPAASAPAARAAEREEDVSEIVVTGSRRREAELESTTPVTQVTGQDVGGAALGNLQKSREAVRPPEEWYAEIEKLRAAGKTREAKRELEKLEAAYPGWLEKNHPPQ